MSNEHITDERLAEVLTEAYGSPEWTMADVRAARAVEAASLALRPAAQPAVPQAVYAWPKLDRPATVGAVTFGSGVSSRLVVQAAQRQAELKAEQATKTKEQMQAEEANRREVWDMLHGSPAAPAAQPVGEPVADVPREWREALQRLVFVAKNSAQNCGCGPDPLLKAAINQACLLLHDRYNYTDTKPAPTTDAARDVLAERQRQIEAEGWTPEHDDVHEIAELAYAAACYTLADLEVFTDTPPAFWPWAPEWWKPRDRRRNLIKAGALILAEIERFDRAAKKGAQS